MLSKNCSEYLIKDLSELDCFCSDLAKSLLDKLLEGNRDIFLLFKGTLAAGKTTSIISLLKALGIRDSASSPTFMGLHEYDIYLDPAKIQSQIVCKFYHLDLYQKNIDLEILLDLMNISEPIIWALEWSEKMDSETKNFLLEKNKLNHLYIYEIEISSDFAGMRKISIRAI